MLRYFMPVEFYFGKDSLKQNGEKIENLGKKAFIVTGKHSAIKSGALANILSILEKLNKKYVIYNKIKENPEISTVYEGVELFKATNCDFIIGIGGGSPIDAAKAISVISKNNFKDKEFFNPKNIHSAYPIVAIPTTSGTGTEVTPFSVISDKKINKKAGFATPYIFPKISFLDPAYTRTLSLSSTRDTAIDALSHLLEGIYSTRRNKINYPYIFKGVELIINNLKSALSEPNNLEYRENLQLASLYGGMVIAQTGTTLQHAIGYPLTTEFGITHGLANGVVMKQIMQLFYPAVKKELDELFAYLKINKSDFFVWLDSFDMKVEAKIDDKFIDKYLNQVMSSKNMLINPIKVKEAEIIKIYSEL